MYFATTKSIDDAVSLTASEEVSTFEVENLTDPLGTSRWRSTGTTPFIIVQFAVAQSIDFWGIFYSNAVSTDTARLRQADTQANLTAAPTKDVTDNVWPSYPSPGTADLSAFPFVHQRSTVTSPVSSLWARIDFNFGSNPAGFVEAGGLFLDSRFTPEFQQAFGWQQRPSVRALHQVKLSGGGTGRGGGTFKEDVNLIFSHMTESEVLGSLNPILRNRKRTTPVAAILVENESTFPMDFIKYGYLDIAAISFNEIRQSVTAPILEP
jgi:hypothetical protein